MALDFVSPKMSAAALWLLDKEAEPADYQCDACCCIYCVFFFARPGALGVRCASCSARSAVTLAADDPDLEQIAAEARWHNAIKACRQRFGASWFEAWYVTAPRGQ